MFVARNCLPAPSEAEIIMKSSVPPNAPLDLPPLVAAYVEATNSFDLERLLATFAEAALVNDQLRDYWGKPAIREWAERDIIGERVTMNVTEVINHYGNFIVTATVSNTTFRLFPIKVNHQFDRRYCRPITPRSILPSSESENHDVRKWLSNLAARRDAWRRLCGRGRCHARL